MQLYDYMRAAIAVRDFAGVPHVTVKTKAGKHYICLDHDIPDCVLDDCHAVAANELGFGKAEVCLDMAGAQDVCRV